MSFSLLALASTCLGFGCVAGGSKAGQGDAPQTRGGDAPISSASKAGAPVPEVAVVKPRAAASVKPAGEAEALEETQEVEAVEAAPIATYAASRTHTVYRRPSMAAERRGRIPYDESFFVYEVRDGEDCDASWARVGPSAWLCLEHAEATTQTPRQLPVRIENSDLPFVYARHRSHRDASAPPIDVYRSLYRLNHGGEVIDQWPAHGSYAFAKRVWNRGAPAFVLPNGHAVSAKDFVRFRPSEFQGRDLLASPLHADTVLAWGLFEETLVYAKPDVRSKMLRKLERHTMLELRQADPTSGPKGARWHQLTGPSGGWVLEEAIARWLPQVPPETVEAGQSLIDVDLEQQVLSVWDGDQARYVTLVSSGKAGDRTPLGLYRLENKWAYGKMASRPDADESYYVDAVPWVMYFSGRYAFHTAYWHNRFGQRMSHGCINLSPRDARTIFEMLSPRLRPGWLIVHESPVEPGSLVRIRRGKREVPDRREPLTSAKL